MDGYIINMTIIPVTISRIEQVTPTIRILEINLKDQHFEYKAGQWIDCYAEIQGERKIVGYSLASSPTTKGSIELAVKISDNPVSEYIHGGAKVGDTLYIEGGQGDIYYAPGMGEKVVLIGAGIGFAPLMGMLRLIDQTPNRYAIVVQSASSAEELVYYGEISGIAEKNKKVTYHPTVTQENQGNIASGRINKDMLDTLDVDPGSFFFLSGPGGMIPELEAALLEMGVPQERIKYEVWWKPEH
jgi:glycine betaine catabolism B